MSSADARRAEDEADIQAGDEKRRARQPSYVTHVALIATGVETENGFAPLEPGMAVTAEIKTGRRSVMSYLAVAADAVQAGGVEGEMNGYGPSALFTT